MVSVKVGTEMCRLFCLAVFTCIAPQGFYAEPPKPPYGGGGSESLCRHCLGFKLYTNQRKFDFGANFAVFKIPF